MARIGIADRLNTTSRMSVIDTSQYHSVNLDPRQLKASENNFYRIEKESIEELADNIAMVGLLQPILVGRVNGEDRIISGHRRHQALLLLIERGNKDFCMVECKVREMSENMFMLTLISANSFTRQLNDFELLKQIEQFKQYLSNAVSAGEIELHGRMRDYIADVHGLSSTKVAQIDSINNNLINEGIEAVKTGDMNFSKAYETSKLPPEEQSKVIKDKSLLSSDVRKKVEEIKQETDDPLPGQVHISEVTAPDYIGNKDIENVTFANDDEAYVYLLNFTDQKRWYVDSKLNIEYWKADFNTGDRLVAARYFTEKTTHSCGSKTVAPRYKVCYHLIPPDEYFSPHNQKASYDIRRWLLATFPTSKEGQDEY